MQKNYLSTFEVIFDLRSVFIVKRSSANFANKLIFANKKVCLNIFS